MLEYRWRQLDFLEALEDGVREAFEEVAAVCGSWLPELHGSHPLSFLTDRRLVALVQYGAP